MCCVDGLSFYIYDTVLFSYHLFRNEEKEVENSCKCLVLTYYRVDQLRIRIVIDICDLQNRCQTTEVIKLPVQTLLHLTLRGSTMLFLYCSVLT
jgi:hypothetical protein